jgi:hypothetical protein
MARKTEQNILFQRTTYLYVGTLACVAFCRQRKGQGALPRCAGGNGGALDNTCVWGKIDGNGFESEQGLQGAYALENNQGRRVCYLLGQRP